MRKSRDTDWIDEAGRDAVRRADGLDVNVWGEPIDKAVALVEEQGIYTKRMKKKANTWAVRGVVGVVGVPVFVMTADLLLNPVLNGNAREVWGSAGVVLVLSSGVWCLVCQARAAMLRDRIKKSDIMGA